MPLEEWLDLQPRIQGRLDILKTEGGGLYRDLAQQLDNELARVERGVNEIQLIANGLLDEARARVQHRMNLIDTLLKP